MILIMEKFQYGQRLEFKVEEVLYDLKTDKAKISFVKTACHGNVLLMDDEVQLSTLDEYRYHETLVHSAMMKIANKPAVRVLILGGGDGCAAREVLKWINVGCVDLVDYDYQFVETFGKGVLSELNENALTNPNVQCHYTHAIQYIKNTEHIYDAIFIDFPDPDSQEYIQLYEDTIKECKNVLHPHGVLSMHVGPVILDENHPNWRTIATCNNTLLSTFEDRNPNIYFSSCYVPSFSNQWGFLQIALNERVLSTMVRNASAAAVESDCLFWDQHFSNTDKDIRNLYARCLRV
jgi:predicted membrane-bound spermidine synthase